MNNKSEKNKIKLFAVYNKDQEKLKDIFIRSIKDDWEVNIVKVNMLPGELRSLEFNSIERKKQEMVVEQIKENYGELLIVSDVDIQFFNKCTPIILKSLGDKDILFQAARVHPAEWKSGDEVNIGFMVMVCNEKNLKLIEATIKRDWSQYNNTGQATVNALLKEKAIIDLKYGVLPEQFWLPKWYKIDPPRDIVMHHAIQTGEKGCNDKNLRIELKIAQMKKIKKYVVININYKQWSFAWVLKKILLCLEEHRLPDFISNYLANKKNKIKILIYILKLRSRHFSCFINKGQPLIIRQKFLYVSAVGQQGKNFLATVIQRFGYKDFDYLIFVYDNTDFHEEIFKGCRFIYEAGLKWQFARKYLTEEYCKKYDYIFIWDDDIDVNNFSYKKFIEIMQKNSLELAQPALSRESYYSHKITLQDKAGKIGRYVDFVEVMIPVFRRDAWIKFRKMFDEETQSGWGYDFLANFFCKFKRMGIVDCETVTHTRPIRSNNTDAPRQMEALFKKFKGCKLSMKVNYGWLK